MEMIDIFSEYTNQTVLPSSSQATEYMQKLVRNGKNYPAHLRW